MSPGRMPSASAVLLLPLCPPTVPHPSRTGFKAPFLPEDWGRPPGPPGFLRPCHRAPRRAPHAGPRAPGLRFTETRSPRQHQPLSLPPSQAGAQPHPLPSHSQPPPQQLQEFQLLRAGGSGEGCFHLVQRPRGSSPARGPALPPPGHPATPSATQARATTQLREGLCSWGCTSGNWGAEGAGTLGSVSCLTPHHPPRPGRCPREASALGGNGGRAKEGFGCLGVVGKPCSPL